MKKREKDDINGKKIKNTYNNLFFSKFSRKFMPKFFKKQSSCNKNNKQNTRSSKPLYREPKHHTSNAIHE